jgi:hypothetical protein
MKHRFSLLTTGFTMIFLRHMPSPQLRFSGEEIIKYSPPENPNLRRDFQLPHYLLV